VLELLVYQQDFLHDREDASTVAKRTKSALKANRQNIKRRLHNRELRSKLRTVLKSIRASLEKKDVEGAQKALSKTVSIVDKMATKGIIHRNTAGRYKSRLSARVTKAGSAVRAVKA
jgi:small subunit ribosomal protein S20